jgi:hypothetical protein
MALWICRNCTCAYAVGLAACPQCGATEHQEDSMPKISVGAGATYEPGQDPAGTTEPTPAVEPPQAAPVAEPDPEPAPAVEPEPAPTPPPAPSKP